MSVNPPFRADIVGSFLRPEAVKVARAPPCGRRDRRRRTARRRGRRHHRARRPRGAGGPEGRDRRRVPPLLVALRLLRRCSTASTSSSSTTASSSRACRPARSACTSTARSASRPTTRCSSTSATSSRVAEAAGVTPKFSIPAPTVLDFRLERDALAGSAYGDHDDIVDDLAATYRSAVQAFYDAGCRYLQFDDTAWAYLCSDVELAKAAERGIRTDHLAERYASLINASLADKPADMVVTTHVCRGNFRSTWISSGGYEPVAEQLLGETDFDGYFLEYDSERAGGFEPLRFLPKGDKVVELGLITTKSGELEDIDADQAAHRRGVRDRAAGAARAQPAVRLRLHRGGQRAHRGRAVGQDRGHRRAGRRRLGRRVSDPTDSRRVPGEMPGARLASGGCGGSRCDSRRGCGIHLYCEQ